MFATSERTSVIPSALGAARRWYYELRRVDPTPAVSSGDAPDIRGAGLPNLPPNKELLLSALTLEQAMRCDTFHS